MSGDAHERTVGVLLAGGMARRMGGGDKCLRLLGGQTLLARAAGRLHGQVSRLLLNANGDPGRFAAYGLPVVADPVPGFAGPLAGVLAGLDWAAEQVPEAAWVASVPTDAPLFPLDLVARLREAASRGEADLACAASGGRRHPVFGLWRVTLRTALREALAGRGLRRVEAFVDEHRAAVAEWPAAPVDPFLNLNRPEDLAAAERMLGLEAENAANT